MREYRIGRLNGRFVVTWADGGSRRRYRLAARTRKEAEAEALDVIRRQTLPRGALTIATLWGAYADHLGDRPTGLNMASQGKAVLPHFGALRPDQITKADCDAYTAIRRAAGKSDGTTHTELGYLRATMAWAQKNGLIERAAPVHAPPKPAPKDRWLTHDEIRRLMAAEAEPHIRLAIVLLLATAARTGAILDLTWDRVDMERGQINLRLDADGPRKGRAIVPINGMARAALTAARAAAMSDHVVEWAGGGIKSILKGFTATAARAGLAGVSPHVLRHTAAVHMVAGGVPMHKVSQYLGHSNTIITERVYGRFAPDHLRDAAEVLDFTLLRTVQ